MSVTTISGVDDITPALDPALRYPRAALSVLPLCWSPGMIVVWEPCLPKHPTQGSRSTKPDTSKRVEKPYAGLGVVRPQFSMADGLTAGTSAVHGTACYTGRWARGSPHAERDVRLRSPSAYGINLSTQPSDYDGLCRATSKRNLLWSVGQAGSSDTCLRMSKANLECPSRDQMLYPRET